MVYSISALYSISVLVTASEMQMRRLFEKAATQCCGLQYNSLNSSGLNSAGAKTSFGSCFILD